jgi:hypothetical protein
LFIVLSRDGLKSLAEFLQDERPRRLPHPAHPKRSYATALYGFHHFSAVVESCPAKDVMDERRRFPKSLYPAGVHSRPLERVTRPHRSDAKFLRNLARRFAGGSHLQNALAAICEFRGGHEPSWRGSVSFARNPDFVLAGVKRERVIALGFTRAHSLQPVAKAHYSKERKKWE